MLKNKALVAGVFSLSLIVLVFGCKSKFEKLRAGNDTGKKYQEALRLYNKKKYSKALILFDDLIQRYRGMSDAEELNYYYAYTSYRLRDYTTARYQFKNFADTYPGSAKAEECRFMAAYCYYLDSPTSSLDQDNTIRAIESLQLFINIYPKSERVAEASKLIDNLRQKLETKAFDNARLYLNTGPYSTENYRAAVIAFRNVLRDFPDTRYAEEVEFLTIRAQYLFGKNSYETRQGERYAEAITYANEFLEKYPKSQWADEAKALKIDAEQGIARAKRLLAAAQAELKQEAAKQDTTVKKKN